MTPLSSKHEEHSHLFLQHINSIDSHIQFTFEHPKDNCSIPFLDNFLSLGPNNTLIASIYRKPINMDQYLQWDSSHILPATYSIFSSLKHRVRVLSTSKSGFMKEQDLIRQALLTCNYPSWALNRL